MKITISNIVIPVISFCMGFGFFWYLARDTIKDMQEINMNTIQIMEEFEGLMERMVSYERGKLNYLKSLTGIRYGED